MPALRKATSIPPTNKEVGARLTEDQAWKRAADNKSELEWAWVRSELGRLVERSMGAAETGVRLVLLLRRSPIMLSYHPGITDTPLSFAGEEGGALLNGRELLPLLCPDWPRFPRQI